MAPALAWLAAFMGVPCALVLALTPLQARHLGDRLHVRWKIRARLDPLYAAFF
jgi:hypothetical protein